MVNFNVNVVVNASTANQGLSQVTRSLSEAEEKAFSLRQAIRNALLALGGLIVIRRLTDTVDTFTNLDNRLKQVTNSTEELTAREKELLDISNQTRTSFEDTVLLYSRMSQATKTLGFTQEQLIDATRTLNEVVATSGASSIEASQAIRQLTQGLGSGKLAGDELRAVFEELTPLTDIIAKQLGVTTGELRKLGAEGKITPQIIIRGLQNAREEVQGKFNKTVITLGQSFVVLGNQVTQFLGNLNASTGAFSNLAQAIVAISQHIDLLGAAAATIGTVLLIQLAQRGIGSVVLALTEMQAAINAGNTLLVAFGGKALGSIGQLRVMANAVFSTKLGFLGLAGVIGTSVFSIFESFNEKARLTKEALDQLSAEKHDFSPVGDDIIKANKAISELFKTLASGRGGADAEKQLNFQLKRLQALKDEARARQNLGKEKTPFEKPDEVERALRSLTEQNQQLQLEISGHHDLAEALKVEQQIRDQQQKKGKDEEISGKTQQQILLITRSNEALARQAELTKQLLAPEEDLKNTEAALFAIREKFPEQSARVQTAWVEANIKMLESSTALGDGITRAFLKLELESKDFAAAGEAAINAFANDSTDALVKFAETGKFQFADFARSLISDLTRIIARLLVVQALTAIFGGGVAPPTPAQVPFSFPGEARAAGGPVTPGRSFVVGEHGPEIFRPRGSGDIIPTGAGGTPQVNLQVVNVDDPNAVPSVLSSGRADQAVMNILARNRDQVSRLVS